MVQHVVVNPTEALGLYKVDHLPDEVLPVAVLQVVVVFANHGVVPGVCQDFSLQLEIRIDGLSTVV